MLVSEYNKFVKDTLQFADRSTKEQREIALYGLIGEIGSLVSAIKKQLLGEHGETSAFGRNEEIIEELGDVMWYCFALSQVLFSSEINIFTQNIAFLKHELSSDDERSSSVQDLLGSGKTASFFEGIKGFPNTQRMHFEDYQSLAFVTARTEGKILLEVCLTSMWQIGALLLGEYLPEEEKELAFIPVKGASLRKNKPAKLLGDIAWYVSAIASLYDAKLSDIAEFNVRKSRYRSTDKKEHTPLFDRAKHAVLPGQYLYPEKERFPDELTIQIVSIGPGQARMYCDGTQLGDDLTDNSVKKDGYRFHDALHLTNAVYLGWSPVLRSFLGRKRKSDEVVDEAEDGARAKIIEEQIISAIYFEGRRQADLREDEGDSETVRLFPEESHVTFKLIKTVQRYIKDLEVRACKVWEWSTAIFQGMELYHQLKVHKQGTIKLDFVNRSHSFTPHTHVNLKGSVVGLGTAVSSDGDQGAKLNAATDAIMEAVLDRKPNASDRLQICLHFLDEETVSVTAKGNLQAKIWAKKVISYRVSFASEPDKVSCTALALSDVKD